MQYALSLLLKFKFNEINILHSDVFDGRIFLSSVISGLGAFVVATWKQFFFIQIILQSSVDVVLFDILLY